MELVVAQKKGIDNYYVNNSISRCGKYIYVTYNTSTNNKHKIMSELMENKDDKLYTIASVYSESEVFRWAYGGFASDDFSLFYLVDGDKKNRLRVRTFDGVKCILREINCQIFTDCCISDYSDDGGIVCGHVSHDNKYLIISYVTDNNVGKNYQKSVIKILDTCNLKEVKSYVLYGNVSNPPKFFRIHDDENYYIIIPTHNVKNDIIHKNVDPPKIRIFKLNNVTLEQICESELPQISCGYSYVRTFDGKHRIIIGTKTSVSDICDPNYINNLDRSYMYNNSDEYRVYGFKRHKLKLIISKRYGFNVYPIIHPTEQKVLIIQYIDEKLSSVMQMFGTNKHYLPCDTGDRAILIRPNSQPNFSANGKWMISTGSNKIDNCKCNLKCNCKQEKNLLLFILK